MKMNKLKQKEQVRKIKYNLIFIKKFIKLYTSYNFSFNYIKNELYLNINKQVFFQFNIFFKEKNKKIESILDRKNKFNKNKISKTKKLLYKIKTELDLLSNRKF